MAVGVPRKVGDHRLGIRFALEEIADRYEEQTPEDPCIHKKVNTDRFADYKEEVVDLVARACHASGVTQRIVAAMKGAIRMV